MTEIVSFNWHWYVGGLLVGIAAVLAMIFLPLTVPLRVAAAVACVSTLAWSIGSLAVSHWVYDRSPLRAWRWIIEAVPSAPKDWCNIHCGLDESSAALRCLFPGANARVLDIFKGGEMTEPSIARARERCDAKAEPADFRRLPPGDASCDTVFLLFAAHELRRPESRDAFFREVRRIVSSEGRVVVAEHLRDAANVGAFGPGAWHFFPRREWLRVFATASLPIAKEFSITPFVRVFVLRRAP